MQFIIFMIYIFVWNVRETCLSFFKCLREESPPPHDSTDTRPAALEDKDLQSSAVFRLTSFGYTRLRRWNIVI